MCDYKTEFVAYSDMVNLFARLKDLQKQSYVFRGQECSEWDAEPASFRDKTFRKHIEKFKNLVCFKDWKRSSESFDVAKKFYASLDVILSNHIHRHLFMVQHYSFCDCVIYEMQYNYCIYNYWIERKKEGNSVSNVDLKNLNDRDLDYWTSKETFLNGLEDTYRSKIPVMGLDGTLIIEPILNESITAINESFAQHYDYPTQLLDFTRNYFVSLYFAVTNIFEKKDYSKDKFFSIICYKERDCKERCVKLIEDNSSIENKRVKAQEGVFLHFQQVPIFLIQHGKPPKLEDYISNGEFDYIKIIVKKTKENIEKIKYLLEEMGITKEYIFPPENNLEENKKEAEPVA